MPRPRHPLRSLTPILLALAMAQPAWAGGAPPSATPEHDAYAAMLAARGPDPLSASGKALDMLGSRYRRGGATERSGMDCSGFVYRSWKDATGVSLPRTARAMAEELERVMPHQLRAGDLVFFNTNGSPFSHVGIYLGGALFAHAPRPGSPARIDSLEGPYWLSAFDGARRPPAGKARQ